MNRGPGFTSETARAAQERSQAVQRERKALGTVAAPSDGGDSPILKLSKTRILEALRAGVDLDPKTLASLIQAAVRLSPAPKTDERPEELDELARRYRAAGFELPFS